MFKKIIGLMSFVCLFSACSTIGIAPKNASVVSDTSVRSNAPVASGTIEFTTQDGTYYIRDGVFSAGYFADNKFTPTQVQVTHNGRLVTVIRDERTLLSFNIKEQYVSRDASGAQRITLLDNAETLLEADIEPKRIIFTCHYKETDGTIKLTAPTINWSHEI
jgi:hypothetical protein